ncbi:PEP-CTERM sorting domain-containing protein [Akkermansiaceae bacterium]|nr:PEP-CTERM sorting domain-containing protein [Akkermansiaceae bacterium]
MNKAKESIVALFGVAAISSPASGATVIPATVYSLGAYADNGTNSSIGTTAGVRRYGEGLRQNDVESTINDPFAYDPLNPTTVSPATGFSDNPEANSFHGGGFGSRAGIVDLHYNVPHTITGNAAESVFVIDLWGRSGNAGSEGRDDNFAIQILDASGASLASLSGVSIPNSPETQFLRASVTLPVGTAIDRVLIESPVSNFTLAEVRFAAVPEPSQTLLIGLAGLGFMSRRRR